MLPAAVIFDFDGVIVDTEPLHYRAFLEILSPMGLGFSWDEYQEKLMGFDDRDAFREVFAEAGKQISISELLNLVSNKAEIFQKIISRGVSAYPGVIDLVDHLKSNHIPIAICSGAVRSDIIPVLNSLNILDSFSHIVSADDVSKSKPSPESYNLAASRLTATDRHSKINRGRIVAIEDTPAGIASAKAAALRVLAVSNSYPSSHLIDADMIVSNLVDLKFDFSGCFLD